MTPLVAWGVIVFSTLATMRWSMARCGIRAVHLFRICVYSSLFVAMQPVIFFMAAILALAAAWGLQWAGVTRTLELGLVQSLLAGLLAIMICVTVLWPFLFLGLAYRRYVRMPHAWGVALAAHVAGLLAVLIVLVCLKVRFLILGFW